MLLDQGATLGPVSNALGAALEMRGALLALGLRAPWGGAAWVPGWVSRVTSRTRRPCPRGPEARLESAGHTLTTPSCRRPRGPWVAPGHWPRNRAPRTLVTSTRHLEDAHSEPLFQRGSAPSYPLVNEPDAHKNTLAMLWPEGHFKVNASGALGEGEAGARSMRCAPGALRLAGSPGLSDSEEEPPRGGPSRRPLHPRSLGGLPGAPHLYVAGSWGRGYALSWEEGLGGSLDAPGYAQKKPRPRNHPHPHLLLRPRGNPQFQPPLAESDSLSGSSSDPQDSGADQYLQVSRAHGRPPRCARPRGRSRTSARREHTDLNGLICSHV